jgi:uncharacterized integral membrane protein
MTDDEIVLIVKKFESYHEADRLRDMVLLEEVKKLTSKTLESIDGANAASDVRTKIVQKSTILNTQWLKLASGAFILAALLTLIIVYNDPKDIAEILKTFLLPLLTAILGFAVYLLGVEAPQKIKSSTSELPSIDHRSDTKRIK